MSDELKPCPFCGSEDTSVRKVLCIRPYEAACHKCFAKSGTFDTKEQAAAAWNSRAAVKERGEDTKRLDALIDEGEYGFLDHDTYQRKPTREEVHARIDEWLRQQSGDKITEL